MRKLIINLKSLDKKNNYFIFLLEKDYQQFVATKNFQGVVADFKWYGFAEQFKMPKLLNKFQLDLMHFPHFNVPIFYTGKFVVTIHDLIHQHHSLNRATALNPLAFKIKQIGYRKVFKKALIKSEKILTPSKSVQHLLTNEWHVPINKITITPEAVDNKILIIANKMTKIDCGKVLNKFEISDKYLFYVGNAHPHKNIEGLIKAFLVLQKKYLKLSLVLSGADHYFWKRLKKEYTKKNIIYTGFITDKELVALYKNAESFIMPSFEEGFGIPLLEAFALFCPVIASNTGSLPEVGGNACQYFDPYNLNELVEKITQVLEDRQLRNKLIEKGKERIKLFSWHNLGKRTLEVYESCDNTR